MRIIVFEDTIQLQDSKPETDRECECEPRFR